ncbi:MAG TPA: family 1 glycosylhydrolase, partial [Anaerolineae bacterium]|nr:family 1 glycosylhydrolase [Anaerolineae bacterium]
PGEFDPEVLDHYRAIVLRLRELGMQPIVTLCHFVWPQHVEDRGGLHSDQFASWFAAFASRVRAALDPHVRYWIAFNEPNIVLQGFFKLWFQPDFLFPPGYPLGTPVDRQIDATIGVIRHLFEAHAAARQALRANGGEHNLVSANVFHLGLPAMVQRLIDRNVTRLKDAEDWRNHFWRVAERPQMLDGRVDLIIAPASEWAAGEFDAAYFITGLAAMVRRDSALNTIADLRGQRAALVRGSAWDQIAAARTQLKGSRIDFAETLAEAVRHLEAGSVAAVVADHVTLLGLARVRTEYRVIDQRLTSQPYVVAVGSGHPGLIDAVQQAIRELQLEAGWIEMYRRHMMAEGVPAVEQPFERMPHAPLSSGLGRIQKRGKLIVGVPRADLPWIDITGSTADRIGVEFDLGRALAGVIFGDTSRVEFRRARLPRRPSVFRRLRNWIDNLLRAYTVFSTFVASSWWYLGLRGQLPDYLCPRACAGQLDFISFDYYFGASALTPGQLIRLAKSAQRQFHEAALWAGGLYQGLRYYHAMFPNLPIVIAENGFAGEPDNPQRGKNIAEHVQSVQRAVDEGLDVRAYCVWSITSNREWGLPQAAASDFGLYNVDMDGDPALTRRMTPSAETYRKLIERRGAT